MKRRKILATAYACEPGVGSEAGIGWNWVRQIARRHDLWLITRENNVAAIQAAARAEGLDGLRLVGFDLPPWLRFWKRGGRGAVPYFYLWQLALAPRARSLDREIGFDLVHHLTFASSWIPSGLSFVRKPFVWGPIGRHARVPDRFLEQSGWLARGGEWLRAAVKRGLEALDPFLGLTRERADLILCISETSAAELATEQRPKALPFLACGTESQVLPPGRFDRGPRFDVLYAGRLVDLKGVGLALAAFAEFAAKVPEAHFTLVGDGPRRSQIVARVHELGLDSRVEVAGRLPREEVLSRMGRSHVFLFPSFEGAGMVVVEAMAAGNPVVCLDFGGPGEMVGTDRGLKAPVCSSFADTARGLAQALERLHGDEPLRRLLARNAHRWANENASWEAKGERLDGFYAQAEFHHAGCSR